MANGIALSSTFEAARSRKTGDRHKPRRVPCHHCRLRRHRCDAPEVPICSRCKELSLPCYFDNSATAHRYSNDQSELAAQVSRLQALLDGVQGGEEATESERDFSPAELDIVASMTKLCFSSQAGGSRLMEGDDLIREGKELLRREDKLAERIFANATPVPTDDLLDADIDQLVKLLPPPQKMQELIEFEQSDSSFCAAEELLYSPVGFAILEDRYEAARSGYIAVDDLAELHAFAACAIIDQDAMTSGTLARWSSPYVEDALLDTTRMHIEAAKRALVLADHIERPTMAVLHALASLAELHLCIWPSTEYISQGIAYCQLGATLAQSLDIHRNDINRIGESTFERYDRMATVSSFARLLWLYGGITGRPTLMHWLHSVPSPDYLENDELPEALRTKSRQSREAYEVLHVRHELARTLQRIALLFVPGSRVTSKQMSELSQEVDSLAARRPHRFGCHVGPDGRIHYNEELTAPRDVILRALSNDNLESCRIALLRICILGYARTRSPGQLEGQSQLIFYARSMLLGWKGMADAGMQHVAAFSIAFPSYLVLCLVVLFDTDVSVPGREHFRNEAMEALTRMDAPEARYTLPAAVRRLVAVMKLLLDRSRVRDAERSGGETSGKRPRLDFGRPSSSGKKTCAVKQEEAEPERPRKSPARTPALPTSSFSTTSSTPSDPSYLTPPSASLPSSLFSVDTPGFDFQIPADFSFSVPLPSISDDWLSLLAPRTSDGLFDFPDDAK